MIDALTTSTQKIAAMKIPLVTISVLTGISGTELSAIFNGQKPCSAEKELRIAKAVNDLENLSKELNRVPIDFRRSEALKVLLEKIAADEVRVLAVDVSEAQ